MTEHITLIAKLATVDTHLDELRDELGDLPITVKGLEERVKECSLLVEATQQKLDEIDHLRGTAHVTTQELHDKEQKLAKQQFKVKNNREFDAITKEIQHIKTEVAELEDNLRTSHVKEENLRATLEIETSVLSEAREKLDDKEKELEELSGDQNDELKKYIKLRLKIIAELDDTLEAEYERIRTFHKEAAVGIRRNSCSGCFSAVPSQKIMEMKYNREKLYACENCGRILYTEEIQNSVDELLDA
ncbi:MAG: hypothetical protein HQ472_09245 [Ignavibacteria bacterium]|nr:hypothetical protein [Ignavibacteria bacterium]